MYIYSNALFLTFIFFTGRRLSHHPILSLLILKMPQRSHSPQFAVGLASELPKKMISLHLKIPCILLRRASIITQLSQIDLRRTQSLNGVPMPNLFAIIISIGKAIGCYRKTDPINSRSFVVFNVTVCFIQNRPYDRNPLL